MGRQVVRINYRIQLSQKSKMTTYSDQLQKLLQQPGYNVKVRISFRQVLTQRLKTELCWLKAVMRAQVKPRCPAEAGLHF